MAYEHKPNTGSLFKNDKKTESKHPDYTGIWKDENGKEFSFAAWIKEGNKGKFFSLSASEKRSGVDNKKDDLPF